MRDKRVIVLVRFTLEQKTWLCNNVSSESAGMKICRLEIFHKQNFTFYLIQPVPTTEFLEIHFLCPG
jgi:hypothetical protein